MTGDRPPPRRTVRGRVWYRERMALSPDAELAVEVVASGPQGPAVLAQARFGTEGRQVPVPFQIEVAVPEGGPCLLRASILIEGRPAWLSQPVPLDDSGDVGDLLLRRAEGGWP